jgi:hypothetical protein
VNFANQKKAPIAGAFRFEHESTSTKMSLNVEVYKELGDLTEPNKMTALLG